MKNGQALSFRLVNQNSYAFNDFIGQSVRDTEHYRPAIQIDANTLNADIMTFLDEVGRLVRILRQHDILHFQFVRPGLRISRAVFPNSLAYIEPLNYLLRLRPGPIDADDPT